jgi:hypothetical protein
MPLDDPQEASQKRPASQMNDRVMLTPAFFRAPSPVVAKSLLGKVIRVYHEPNGVWLSAQIIETVLALALKSNRTALTSY